MGEFSFKHYLHGAQTTFPALGKIQEHSKGVGIHQTLVVGNEGRCGHDSKPMGQGQVTVHTLVVCLINDNYFFPTTILII